MLKLLKRAWLTRRQEVRKRDRRSERARRLGLDHLECREMMASFQDLGGLAGNPLLGTKATAVSANGQVVVGSSGGYAFRWESGNMIPIRDAYNSMLITGESRDVSADGSAVIGTGPYGDFIFDNNGIYQDARYLFANVGGKLLPIDSIKAISDNGNVIVGGASNRDGPQIYPEPYRWEVADGWAGTHKTVDYRVVAPSAKFKSGDDSAQMVSADGTVVAGITSGDTYHEPFRWEKGTLKTISNYNVGNAKIYAMSPEGEVLGFGNLGRGTELFKWGGDGVTSLGAFAALPHAMSQNIQFIVGQSVTGGIDNAIIWDKDHGIRNLRDVLVREQNLGNALTGWSLQDATSITPDGLTIVGDGINPQGQQRAWVAHLSPTAPPTPPTNPPVPPPTVPTPVPPATASATVEVNNSADKSDNVTLYNSPGTGQQSTQTIQSRVTNTGTTTTTFQLRVIPANYASLDRMFVTLAAGASTEVTVTPQAVSTSAYDVRLVASSGGNDIAQDEMTFASILIPQHVRHADTPVSMKDRIPPRVATRFPVMVSPDLTNANQSVSLTIGGQDINHGSVKINNRDYLEASSSQIVDLVGIDQTKATASYNEKGKLVGMPGGFAGQLFLQLSVRGQVMLQSLGFSIAAIPLGLNESTYGVVNNKQYAGILVDELYDSDSGDVRDLIASYAIEQVRVAKASGIFKKLTKKSIKKQDYLLPIRQGSTDEHSVKKQFIKKPGGKVVVEQLQIAVNLVFDETPFVIQNSGYNITTIVSYDKNGYDLKIIKEGFRVSVNGYESSPGMGFIIKTLRYNNKKSNR